MLLQKVFKHPEPLNTLTFLVVGVVGSGVRLVCLGFAAPGSALRSPWGRPWGP